MKIYTNNEIDNLLSRILSKSENADEGQIFELKSSALNKDMRYEMLKTITAFLNSHNTGFLFIGISNDRDLLGIQKTEDKFHDTDTYEQRLISIIKLDLHDGLNRISQNIRFHFKQPKKNSDAIVCALEIRPFFPKAGEFIAHCNHTKNNSPIEKTFFKRTGTTSTKMTAYDVAMDMIHRLEGQIEDPQAPSEDAGGKGYDLTDNSFILKEVNEGQIINGKKRTELILENGGKTYRKLRNEDGWKHTSEFIEKAKGLLGQPVKLTSWESPENEPNYWWDRGYIANIYPINVNRPFNK